MSLTWVLDDGTRLIDGAVTPTGVDGQVQISCTNLAYEQLHFLSLFVGSGTAKKVFTFRAPPPPGPN